ncbi:MAG: hypothetical protein JNK35_11090 [Phycisphaerae bacterium]|nr:hypothetical protein [Phycisphaerae bacterium]
MDVPRWGWPRWRVLAAVVVAQSVLGYLAVLASWAAFDGHVQVDEFWRAATHPEGLAWAGVGAGIILALQVVLLWPVRRPVMGPRPKSLALTAAVAGLAGTGVLAATVLLLLDVVYLATPKGWVFLDEVPNAATWVWSAVGLSWLVMTPLVWAFLRGVPTGAGLERRMSSIANRLLMGTAIDVVASIPIGVMVRRRTDCYCAQGTFWAIVVYVGLGALLIGPAVILPLLTRRRRGWYQGRCPSCGYDMKGLADAPRCPECGAGWRT